MAPSGSPFTGCAAVFARSSKTRLPRPSVTPVRSRRKWVTFWPLLVNLWATYRLGSTPLAPEQKHQSEPGRHPKQSETVAFEERLQVGDCRCGFLWRGLAFGRLGRRRADRRLSRNWTDIPCSP